MHEPGGRVRPTASPWRAASYNSGAPPNLQRTAGPAAERDDEKIVIELVTWKKSKVKPLGPHERVTPSSILNKQEMYIRLREGKQREKSSVDPARRKEVRV
jgi:hypothetical protein